MIAVEHDTVTESEMVEELLSAHTTKKREKEELIAPRGFDPAAVFLLSLTWSNLFEATPNPMLFRCKGCTSLVPRSDREKHHASHKRSAKSREARSPKDAANGTAAVPTPRAPREPRTPRERPAIVAAEAGSRADSARVLEALWDALQNELPGVTRHDNAKVGYSSFKMNGRLIGYGWLTGKPDLRIEAALPLGTIADERIVACNRSEQIASRTRVDETGFPLALAMLTQAAAIMELT